MEKSRYSPEQMTFMLHQRADEITPVDKENH